MYCWISHEKECLYQFGGRPAQCEMRTCADQSGRAYRRIEYIVYLLNLLVRKREGRVRLTHSFAGAIKDRSCFMTIAMFLYCKKVVR